MKAEKVWRIVLLCRGTRFETWEAEAIRALQQLPFVQIVLRVEEIPHAESEPATYLRPRHLLWRWHNRRYLRKIHAYQPADLSESLRDIPIIRCRTEKRGRYTELFSGADIETIRTYQPDIIVRFAFNILRGEILTLAPYGMWSFHHADIHKIRGGPGALWEIMRGDSATGAVLQRLTEKLDGGIVLKSGWFPTVAHSYAANLDQLLMGTANWMALVCTQLHFGQEDVFHSAPVQTSAPVLTYPTNGQMLRLKMKLWRNKIQFHFRELFRAEQWNIGIVDQTLEETALKGISKPVTWLGADEANRYKADPFGIPGTDTILFERYDYRVGKGWIESFDGKNYARISQADFHHSYPYTFSHEGKNYIIPETFEAGDVSLYTTEANGLLNRVRPLLKIPAVDSSLIFHENRWWIFCTREDQGSNNELHIYYAENLTGEFQPHALNPVKTDIHSARPAGTIFVSEGKIYRPAQDCSSSYGAAVVVHEITELSPYAFAEKQVQRIVPATNWNWNKGLHTISRFGNKTLIDAKRYSFSFANFRKTLRRKIFGK